jgi:hypothetical protein
MNKLVKKIYLWKRARYLFAIASPAFIIFMHEFVYRRYLMNVNLPEILVCVGVPFAFALIPIVRLYTLKCPRCSERIFRLSKTLGKNCESCGADFSSLAS